MARIRTFKPEFFRSETIAELSPMARLCFMGLWTLADRDGRLEDRPRRIKAELFPYDDINAVELLNELEKHGLILRYVANNEPLIWIPKFREHQRLNTKENETLSKFPPHPNDKANEATGKQPRSTQEAPKETEGNTGDALGTQPDNTGDAHGITGREGKGKERNIEFTNVNSLGGKTEKNVLLMPLADPWIFDTANLVIEHLNRITGKKYTAESGESSCLRARIKDAGKPKSEETANLCRLIIDFYAAQWLKEPKMKQYLCPSTLFAPTKWESRTQNALAWEAEGRPSLMGAQRRHPATDPRRQSVQELWEAM